ncbi:Endo-1,4-beta-xylanase C, partial [Striga asiatica]
VFMPMRCLMITHLQTRQCLATPLRSQYDGGIVVNPEFNEGLKGWTQFGDINIEHQQSDDGNKYIVASKRNQSFHSLPQIFNLENEKLYTFSAWLQVSNAEADIAAVFKSNTSYVIAGWVTAKKGCWSFLKGGLTVNESGPAQLYFESQNSEVDIWADSISLQPFTQEEWISHQRDSLEKARKGRVKLQALDQHGRPVPNATVSIKQARGGFPLGVAINNNFLNNAPYQTWFFSRFKHAVFENELKWVSNEPSRGSEDYSTSDALVRLLQSRGVAIRGHNVLWADAKFQPGWVGGLSPADLRSAAMKRVNSVVGRYKGQLIHWDVMNENLHFNFFETKLGNQASRQFYSMANKIDGRATPFLNEYNTIEDARDGASSPAKYLGKIREFRAQGYNGPLGIGVQGHFSIPNLPFTRSAIDALASARLPIWVTELDVTSGPNQASYLDQVLHEIHSHPAVQGIILWVARSQQGCYTMCLTDGNFKNLATGDVVDRFRGQLAENDHYPGTTDSDGFYEDSFYHGEYEVTISHPSDGRLSNSHQINVVPQSETGGVRRITINV